MSTAKQTCKKASLKIGIEAHHGLEVQVRNVVDSHDKLLSAAVSATNVFDAKTITLCKPKIKSKKTTNTNVFSAGVLGKTSKSYLYCDGKQEKTGTPRILRDPS